MSEVFDYGNRIHMIDLHDLNMKGRTGSYVIKENELTIVETSASPSIPYLLKGLKRLNIDPSDIKYIIVTHIHLDHAGGAGLFLENCPNAKVIVHPKGYRHLANPEKLIAGARAVYGSDFDKLFNPILPIPEERLIAKADGDSLELSENCTLTFYDTPGHAKHHFSIYDPISNGVFTGDTTGVYYPELLDCDVELYLPTTSPSQYDPTAMLKSVNQLRKLKPDYIYFGHFGKSSNPNETFRQIEHWTPLFVTAGKKAFSQSSTRDFESLTSEVTKNLFSVVNDYLESRNVPKSHKVYEILDLDLKVCAMGIVDYLLKEEKK